MVQKKKIFVLSQIRQNALKSDLNLCTTQCLESIKIIGYFKISIDNLSNAFF